MIGSPTKSGLRGLRYLPLLGALTLIIVSVAFTGCTSQTPPGTDGPTTQTPLVTIADIFNNTAAYNGTAVAVQGTINAECGSGCWFILDDGTGTLYVDLAPNNFVIPQIAGSTVVVHGTIGMKNGDPVLSATRVVTDSRTWP